MNVNYAEFQKKFDSRTISRELPERIRINHFPMGKCGQNKLHYPPDSDLSGRWCYPTFEQLGLGQ